jgi:hypothetical protein
MHPGLPRYANGVGVSERQLAHTARAHLAATTYNSASATVPRVKGNVGTNTVAIRTAARATTACPLVTDRGRLGADVSAGAAVVRIGAHVRANPVAAGRSRSATDIRSTASTESAGITVARPASFHALVPLRSGGTRSAEGGAAIRPGSPGGIDAQRAECRAGQHDADHAQ